MRAFRLLLAALLVPLPSAGCSKGSVPEPVWVGHVVPLSGPDGALGEHARQGVQLAVAEARADDKAVAGRPIQFLHADSRSEGQVVSAEAVRLLTVNKVVALLAGPDASLAGTLARTARGYDVPVVLPCEQADLPAAEGVVSLGADPAVRGRGLARYAAADLGAGRAVVLTDRRNPVAARLASAFGKAWRLAGKAPVEEHAYAGDATHADVADRAARAKADVVLIAGTPVDFRDLRGRLRGFGVKKPVLYGGADLGASVLQGEPGADTYLATAYAASGLSDRGREFAARYEKRFREPPDLAAAQAYDGARLLIDALHSAQDVRADRVRAELARQVTFESVTGPVSWKDRRPRRRVFVVRLGHRDVKVVKTIDPTD